MRDEQAQITRGEIPRQLDQKSTKRPVPEYEPEGNVAKKPKLGYYPLSEKDIERAKHEIRFEYKTEKGRFVCKAPEDLIKNLILPDKLSFMLGFEHGQIIKPYTVAKYTPDIRASIRRFCVYENSGLTELMMFGDRMTSLLRVVSVKTEPGQDDEQIFTAPIYKRVLSKEIEDIEIEVKTMDNKYVPFNYGEFILILVFKRVY